ncbi:NUDIX domain-containing protein [Micromonospora sp. AMSO12t]|uniref:NUDIX domain-containing protein n=1 Tax=Micromonospora sp. AMSO12t TaxID=2650410 RepID=UPI00351BAD7A
MPPEGSDFTAGLPRKRMGAGLLVTDPAGRVLLVEPAYKTSWEIPGGCVEADESPHRTAARECREELGLAIEPGRLLVVDWVPPRHPRTEGVMFVYDGGRLTPSQAALIVLPPAELRSWSWCDRREADGRLVPLLARRVAEALAARDDGVTRYLEDGFRVS